MRLFRPRAARRASYSEGAAYGTLSFVAMGVLGVGSAIAIARVYGIETIGAYALVMAPTNIVWYLSSARERAAFVRELAALEVRAPRITGLFWAMFAFSLGLTLLVGGLAALGTHLLFDGPIGRPDLFLPAMAYLATFVFVLNAAWNIDAVFLGFRAGRELFWIRLHLALAFLAFSIGLGLAWDSVWGLVIANLASGLTTFAHRLVLVRPYMRAFVSRGELREGFRTLPDLILFGLKIVPGSIAKGVSWGVPTWVIALSSPLTALGAFNRAQTLARRVGELDYRITGMLMPTMVERRLNRDDTGFDRAFVDTVRYAAATLLLPAAVGAGAAHGIMSLFGPGFASAADALAILLLMPVLMSVANVQGATLLGVDKPGAVSVNAVLALLVNVGVTVPLTSAMGITGAALGLVSGAAVLVVLNSIVSFRELSQPLGTLWRPREVVALAAASAAGFAVARAIDSALEGVVAVLPALAAGSLTYVAVLALAGGVNERDRARLRSLRARLRRRSSRPGPVVGEAG